MKNEHDFILKLEGKAKEQKKLTETELLPSWAKGVGEWLVVNPWRVLVPLSALIYGLVRAIYGDSWRELILGVFGGY